MSNLNHVPNPSIPWNKGKLVGQKPPLKLKEIWSIRIRLQIANRKWDLALFNLAIDSKLRSCDLLRLRVRDVTHGGTILIDRRLPTQSGQFLCRKNLPQYPRHGHWRIYNYTIKTPLKWSPELEEL